MKANSLLLLVVALWLNAVPALLAAPLATAFTYQGKLNDGAAPATGSYDFRFILFDAAAGGSALGTASTVEDLAVVGGVFTTSLDFGAVFDGSSRWLEIAVRHGASIGAFTVLSPRQPLTAAPFALYALTPAGPQGVQGLQGNKGDVGTTGPTGASGSQGLKGDTGLTGPQGLAGPTGSPGAVGAKGDKGDIGVTGSTGAQGSSGAKGDPGLIGPAGPAGAKGSQGIQGVVGPVGATGPQGPLGLTGATGVAGPVGPAGAKGEKGVNWRGAWNGVAAYAIGDGVAQNGASWLAKAVNSGTAPSVGNPSWDLLADKGATGAAGPTGLQGPQGIPGSADGWSRTGNAGTTAGANFVGTTDDQPFEIKVNGLRVLRFEPKQHDTFGFAPNVIGGSSANDVGGPAVGATIAGGVFNQALSDFSTIGGGLNNASGNLIDDGDFATTAGGHNNFASGNSSFIGGGADNDASGGYATVGGGNANTSSGTAATVAGGEGNTASRFGDTVGGGLSNISSGSAATVGGGAGNISGGSNATVGGGYKNTSSGFDATVSGGKFNTSSGEYATVPGGLSNFAGGLYSFAAGYSAKANHDGSFVWAIRDNPAPSFAASRFHINTYNGLSVEYDVQRADGGGSRWILIGVTGGEQAIVAWNGAWLSNGGAWINASDRNRKDNFAAVSPSEILDKLAALPIQTWHYTNETTEIRHLGPVAQDFHAAFGLGSDDKSIATVDADGVALAAIQGLNQKLEQRLAKQDDSLLTKDTRIAALEQRLATLERLLSTDRKQ